MDETKNRNRFIDALKGLAMIMVALYHFGTIIISVGSNLKLNEGLMPFGYLGVDIFFVISGYFLIKGLCFAFVKKQFNYFSFVFHKLIRLWPLVLMVSAVSLVIGFVFMLPDDYENLAESVAASVFFSNNILACITTKNYWNTHNLYKPLMHLWYVGVLMKAYVVLPLFYLVVDRFCKNKRRGIFICTLGLTLISFCLFILPYFTTAMKFYYLPFRIWEITIGGLVFFCSTRFSTVRTHYMLSMVAFIVLLTLLLARDVIVSKEVMLSVVVLTTVVLLHCAVKLPEMKFTAMIKNAAVDIGERSYSIYIWHQFVIAFLFYSVYIKTDPISFPVFIVLTAGLSWLSYRFVELPTNRALKNSRKEIAVIAISILTAAILCALSLWIYFRAGVIRDIPELDIDKNNVHRHMHAEYCDRPYKWDKDFTKQGVPHVLVFGNSFGRDWANILYEYDSSLDISYVYYTKDNFLSRLKRIDAANIVFYAMGNGYERVPEVITKTVPINKLLIIGNKKYGESNGIIYAKRFSSEYFQQTVTVPNELLLENTEEAVKWGERYIDMLKPISNPDGTVHVFTDDKKYISQDCEHLTQAGARYYARVLNVGKILEPFKVKAK